MAAEVVWIRLYTYFVGPFVYSFAKILASYLLATFCGSQVYRFWSRRAARQRIPAAMGFAGILWSAAAADRGRPHRDAERPAHFSRRVSLLRRDRFPDADAGGSLVGRRSRPRRPRLCRQRRRLHYRPAAGWIHPAAAVRRAPLDAAAGAALVRHGIVRTQTRGARPATRRVGSFGHRGGDAVLLHQGLRSGLSRTA